MTGPPPTAIGKMVTVLEALATEQRLSGIVRLTGLPSSTVHRILQELATHGWVQETTGRDYVLGPRLLGLALRAGEDSDVARAARPSLLALNERTGYTVHLAVRHSDEVVYADKLDGRRAYRMRSSIGLAVPLHSTAIGKAILAKLPDEQVRDIAGRTGLPSCTAHTITDVEVLLGHLAGVRERGFAIDDQENEQHTRCVGAAVVDHRGTPVAGVSLSGLAFDLNFVTLQRLAPLVGQAAREVSAALGAH